MRQHLVAGCVLSAVLVGVALGIGQLTGREYLGALAATALVISLWRFYLPVMFEVNADGVHQWVLGRHRQTAWESIQRIEILEDGVLLLPAVEGCALDALRGLYLPWVDHRDEVLAGVRQYWPGVAPAGRDAEA